MPPLQGRGKQGCLNAQERDNVLPLSHSEVPWRAAAEVAALRVGAAVAARVLGGGALVHIMAGTGELVEGEPGGAGALVTPQGVVAGGRATGTGVGTFILICSEKKTKKLLHRQGAGAKEMKVLVSKDLSVHRAVEFKHTLRTDFKVIRRVN